MTEKATEGDFVVAEGPSVWGKSRGGWHFHDGEFVGLYWFLWAGESWATVVAPAATQLQDLFSGIAGSPVDVGEASGPATGFRASWTVDGYSIEMYAHGPDLGGDVPDERATAVQLHVDHASRSAREDAAARPASAAVQDRNGWESAAPVAQSPLDIRSACNRTMAMASLGTRHRVWRPA